MNIRNLCRQILCNLYSILDYKYIKNKKITTEKIEGFKRYFVQLCKV